MAISKLVDKILCPVDLDHSLKALDFAVKLAQQNDAQLYVVNVVFPPDTADVAEVADQQHPYWEMQNRVRLDKLAKEHLQGQVKYEADVLSGEPAFRILQKATEYAVDLIVMPTYGRHLGMSNFFVGSVAEVVVRDAPCPVLTIRPK